MKKFNWLKTFQLILMLVFLGICAYMIFFDMDLYHAIAQNVNMRKLCWMLWASFALTFIFIFLDFSFLSDYKREYRELDFAVHSDPLSGLANRNSCDALIEQYMGKPLPEGLGCIMIELTNIYAINKKFGHTEGNNAIKEFSHLLMMASVSLCFVGRNGGNRFLAIFEESKKEDLDVFLDRLEQKTCNYNAEHPEKPLAYSYGVAFDEPGENLQINQMVALASRRIAR